MFWMMIILCSPSFLVFLSSWVALTPLPSPAASPPVWCGSEWAVWWGAMRRLRRAVLPSLISKAKDAATERREKLLITFPASVLFGGARLSCCYSFHRLSYFFSRQYISKNKFYWHVFVVTATSQTFLLVMFKFLLYFYLFILRWGWRNFLIHLVENYVSRSSC